MDKITELKLKDICKIYKGKGLSLNQVNTEQGQECILYGDLYTIYDTNINHIYHKTMSEDGVLSKGNTVLIPGDTTTSAWEIATAAYLDEPNVKLGASINILEFDDNYDGLYFAYMLKYAKKKDLARLAQGSTIVHLYGKDIGNINISVPPLQIQQKIGSFSYDKFKSFNNFSNSFSFSAILTFSSFNSLFTCSISIGSSSSNVSI